MRACSWLQKKNLLNLQTNTAVIIHVKGLGYVCCWDPTWLGQVFHKSPGHQYDFPFNNFCMSYFQFYPQNRGVKLIQLNWMTFHTWLKNVIKTKIDRPSLPFSDLRCCTAILSTVSLSSLRDMGLQVGIIADSLSMRLFILSLLLFSIWLCGSLHRKKWRNYLKDSNYMFLS